MMRSVGDLSGEIRERYKSEDLTLLEFDFLGFPVNVRSNSPECVALLDGIYGSFRSGTPCETGAVSMFLMEEEEGGGRSFLVADPGFNSFVCEDSSQALGFWGAQLMVNHLYRGGFLFLHGTVLVREAKALIFMGGSRSGKTTLTLRLREAGWTLYSDEFAPLEVGSGLVHPFLRSFLLREDCLRWAPPGHSDPSKLPFFYDHQEWGRGEPTAPKRYIVAPGNIFAKLGGGSVAVGAIFFLDGFAESATQFRPLPASAALERLFAHAVNPAYLSPENKERALQALVSILNTVPAFSVCLGSLDEEPSCIAQSIVQALARGRAEGVRDLDRVAQECRNRLQERSQKG